MLPYNSRAKWDTIRSATAAAITGSYGTIGAVLSTPAVVVCFKNATNGEVLVSIDGTNDHIYMAANSFTIYDVRTNAPEGDNYSFREGTQFYVKDGTTASTTGTFYLEVLSLTKAS